VGAGCLLGILHSPTLMEMIMERITYVTPHHVVRGTTPRVLYSYYDSALVVSEEHARVKGQFLTGGPFYMRRRQVSLGIALQLQWNVLGVVQKYSPYVGPVATTQPVFPVRSSLVTESSGAFVDSLAFGAQGWKRTRPGNPVANVATFIGEARDWAPSLPRRLYNALGSLLAKKQAAKRQEGFSGLGDAWLNVHFGWMPLLKDIRSMYELSQTLDKRLAQIERDNGKGIRRRTILRDSIDKTISTQESPSVPFGFWNDAPPGHVSGYSKVDRVTTVSDKIWYSARYRYWIPDIGTNQWTNRARRALYGANITPEVVWNLLPWSWLIDWFANIGDIVSNASSNAVDNLTADYAFVMRQRETTVTWEATTWWNGRSDTSVQIQPGRASVVAVDQTVTKARFAASPFGFGTTFDSLSSYQLGIVAALGISRW